MRIRRQFTWRRAVSSRTRGNGVAWTPSVEREDTPGSRIAKVN
jgi:hypothetical protein